MNSIGNITKIVREMGFSGRDALNIVRHAVPNTTPNSTIAEIMDAIYAGIDANAVVIVPTA